MDTATLRALRLGDHVLGFYDGRTPRKDAREEPDNWIDDGALSLGICSYAIIDGPDAIVYDTHVSVEHAQAIRRCVEGLGARKIRVVLSHWHLDHIAGTEVFADCEIIANRATFELLREHREAIEGGTLEGPPSIAPLVLPTTLFDGRLAIDTRNLRVELIQFDIHTHDATVLYLPGEQLLLAGDTVEDTVTYVSEAAGIETHIVELDRLRGLGAGRILPNHGSFEAIDAGGYSSTLIDATQTYLRDLLSSGAGGATSQGGLQTFARQQLAAGWITWFEPYERVHESNLAAAAAAST
jgi:glyoxylase-like metal-dependent hydrolase (beta-lactamase superfamily II)